MATADDISGSRRVRDWVAERATALRVPVSIEVLCETAVRRLGVTGITQTIEPAHGWPETVYATDQLGVLLAELQVTVGEGPCLDVWREGGPVLVPELDTPAVQRRWPLFAPLAVENGAEALFALPMAVGAIRVGVFALHLVEPGRLDPLALSDALAFAHLALQLNLDSVVGFDGSVWPEPHLYGAQVHQATGIIAVQLGVAVDEAFNRLRARAFADDRSLSALAADVVARLLRFDRNDDAQ
jgi:hypothetical protein